MGQAITITNLDYSAADLRRLMSQQKDGAVVRRLMALALILEGQSRTEAARQSGMERQTLRDWVHRYNAEGVAGLSFRVGPGPSPLLTEAQMAELKELVVKGPDPETAGSSAGVALICATRSSSISRSRCTNEPWPSGCANWS
jgi:transposase-like protein